VLFAELKLKKIYVDMVSMISKTQFWKGNPPQINKRKSSKNKKSRVSPKIYFGYDNYYERF